jgi:hypothetical protein
MSYSIFKKALTDPQQRTVTMLTNVAEKYGLTYTKAKNSYFQALFEVVSEKVAKPTKLGYADALSKLQPEEYRIVWYKLHNKLQSEVGEQGGKQAKTLAKLQAEAQAIIKSDIARLSLRVKKLERDVASGTLNRLQKGLAKEKIAMYREYLRKAKNKESLGHFTQMLRDHPDLTSFLFKPKR